MSATFSEYFNLGNSVTKLNNGDFMIWYGRRNGNEKACFQIIRVESGEVNLRKQETIVSTGTTIRWYLECSALLSDNNIVIVYLVTGSLYFAIYNESGEVIKAATDTGYDVVHARGLSVAALTGGGFSLCFADSGGHGKFVIYDNSGTETVSVTTITTSTVYDISVTPLDNGNFFIAYNLLSGAGGEFAIYGADGSEVVASTEFNAQTDRFESTTTLSNGNVVIAFLDSDNKQYFMIYDEDGNAVKAKTEYSDDLPNSICAKAADDGGFYIAYSHSVNTGVPGTYIKFASDGTEESTTVFKSNKVDLISFAGESGSYVVIIYRNAENSWYGEINLDWLGGTAFAPPYDSITYKRLVAAAADTIWYEDI